MVVEDAIHALLLHCGTVDAIAGQRIFRDVAPQGQLRPYVVIQRISYQAGQSLNGRTGLGNARIQIDSFSSESSGQAADLDKAICDFLVTCKGDVAGVAIGSIAQLNTVSLPEAPFEGHDRPVFRYVTDYSVWFREFPV